MVVCSQRRIYVPAHHALLSAYGKNWSERLLAMFTAYIDDSGTASTQKVAIATALIIPARRIIRFQSEWNTFCSKWGVSDFHASECAVGNYKSNFRGWEKTKIEKAFRRIRQIIKKYGIRCFSLGVHKDDYDAVVPSDLRPIFGDHHYTWAMHSLLAFIDRWACDSEVEHPVEYVFDWINPKSDREQLREIEDALARSEEERPGRFAGHYSFRRRIDFPGLQCVDLLGWTCYRFALQVFAKTPMTDLQRECWNDFSNYRPEGPWLIAVGQTRVQIQEAVKAQLEMYGLNRPRAFRPNLEL